MISGILIKHSYNFSDVIYVGMMRWFSIGLVIIGLVSVSTQWKLNVPRVLLPLTEEGAEYKLFSEGGCFDWKSSRPEVRLDTHF